MTVFIVNKTIDVLKSGLLVAPISIENLEAGQQVSLNGFVCIENEIETWTAYRVTVGANLTQTHKKQIT